MTTTPSSTVPAGPAGVVARAVEVLDELDEVLWAAKTPAELLATVRQLEVLRSRVCAVHAQVDSEVATTDAALVEGWVSVKDYLTSVAGGRKGAGKRMLRLAGRVDRGAGRDLGRAARRQNLAGAGAGDRVRDREAAQ